MNYTTIGSKYDSSDKLLSWGHFGKLPVSSFKKRVWKNIIFMSIVFMLAFTAMSGLTLLQSSLHVQEGMGVICSSVLYVAMVLSCLILPKPLIDWLGHKWVVTLSLIGYIIWMAANGYAVWATMVQASIFVGLSGAPLWTAQCSYMTELGRIYGEVTGQKGSNVIALFFGVFLTFFQASAIFGSIISFTVLMQSPPENYTALSEEDTQRYCGMNDCPWNNNTNFILKNPPSNVVWILCGIYIGLGVLALIVSAIFIDNLPDSCHMKDKGKTKKSACAETVQLLGSTAKQTVRKKQLLLIPLTIYRGIVQTFITAEWNKSWVVCPIGIWMVGLIGLSFAVVDAVTSFAAGSVTKCTGRRPLFVAALLLDTGVQITIAVWKINPDQIGIFYAISGIWGLSDGIWQTQINALYGSIFIDDSEAAFANFALWESIGFVVAFGYSYFLCTSVKLYITLSLLWISIIGYFVVEWIIYKEKNDNLVNLSDGASQVTEENALLQGKDNKRAIISDKM